MTIPLASYDVRQADNTDVLIVSQDAAFSEACARVLREEGFVVQTAAHSGHALLACMEGRRIDVLIADLSMDEGSAPELARRMRRYNPRLKALFLARPFTREDLLGRLQQVLATPPEATIANRSAYF